MFFVFRKSCLLVSIIEMFIVLVIIIVVLVNMLLSEYIVIGYNSIEIWYRIIYNIVKSLLKRRKMEN